MEFEQDNYPEYQQFESPSIGEQPQQQVEADNYGSEFDPFDPSSEQQEAQSFDGDQDAYDDERALELFNAFGVEVDQEAIKGKSMTREQILSEIGRNIASKYLESQDPLAARALKEGVDYNQYRQAAQQFEQVLSMNDADLGRQSIFERLWDAEAQAGNLGNDQSKNTQYVSQLVDEYTNRWGNDAEKKLAALGTQYRAGIQQNYDKLGLSLKQDQEAQWNQYKENYQKQNEAFFSHKNIQQYLNTGGVVGYTGDQEKSDFEKYAKDMFTLQESGRSKFFDRILNDGKFAMDLIRVAHLMETKRFDAMKNMPVSKAFQRLDSILEKPGGGQKQGGLRLMDTSKPH